jgi:HAMP domain-containing protein
MLAETFAAMGVAADAAGNLFVADWSNSRVRKVASIGRRCA